MVLGTVKVRNLNFKKEVIVRTSCDDWKSQEDTTCTYYTVSEYIKRTLYLGVDYYNWLFWNLFIRNLINEYLNISIGRYVMLSSFIKNNRIYKLVILFYNV